jgi:dynein heavy chain
VLDDEDDEEHSSAAKPAEHHKAATAPPPVKKSEPSKEGHGKEVAAEEGKEKESGEEKPEGEGVEEEKNEEVEEAEAAKKGDSDEPISPRSLKKRVEELIESLTYTAYQTTRRGLFETHKLIVATMLCLRVLLRAGELESDEVDHLVIGKVDLNPTQIPDSLKSFLNDNIWAACRALESISHFQGFC